MNVELWLLLIIALLLTIYVALRVWLVSFNSNEKKLREKFERAGELFMVEGELRELGRTIERLYRKVDSLENAVTGIKKDNPQYYKTGKMYETEEK